MTQNSLKIRMLNNSIIANCIHMIWRYLYTTVIRRRKVVVADSGVDEKRKQKLAVIGTGASINQLPDDFFENLQDYDIAAFSFSALLPMKSIDFYLYEIPRPVELQRLHKTFLYPELVRKHNEGKLKHIILKNPHEKSSLFYQLFPRVQSSITFAMMLRFPNKLATMLNLISGLGLAKKAFFQTSASLFSTCYWADALGYKEILLVGVDLNTSRYFYEEKNKWIDEIIPNHFPKEIIDSNVHPTNNGLMSIKLEDAMLVLKEHISANILIQNPTSALAKSFDVYRPLTRFERAGQTK